MEKTLRNEPKKIKCACCGDLAGLFASCSLETPANLSIFDFIVLTKTSNNITPPSRRTPREFANYLILPQPKKRTPQRFVVSKPSIYYSTGSSAMQL